MHNRGLFAAAIMLACLSLGSVLGADDATMKEVMARLKALEDKNRDLETKLKKAETTATRRSSVDKAVDRAMITSEQKLGTVITAPDQFNRPLKIGGSVDVSYQYNFNRPDNNNNNFRVFDKYHNSFNANYAEVFFERLPNNPGEAGFRIDLGTGADTSLFASRTYTGTTDRLFDLQQAYIEYIAPVGTGITIDAGKFVTWSGYEVIEAADNMNASRSLLFGYAIPFAHTGIRATYNVFKDKWKVGLGIVNGWDNIQDENQAKTAIFMSDWKPVSWFQWIVTGAVGDEAFASEQARFDDATADATLTTPDADPADPTDPTTPGARALANGKLFDSRDTTPRFLVDTSLIFTPWEKWTFVINADYAVEDTNDFGGGYNAWWGVAGYAKWQFLDKWYLALRGEVFNDKVGGSRTGSSQALYSATATLNYNFTEASAVRLELRHDGASDHSFSRDEGIDGNGVKNDDDFTVQPNRHSQNTVMLQFLYRF